MDLRHSIRRVVDIFLIRESVFRVALALSIGISHRSWCDFLYYQLRLQLLLQPCDYYRSLLPFLFHEILQANAVFFRPSEKRPGFVEFCISTGLKGEVGLVAIV